MKKFLEELEKNPELKAKMEELDKNPASTPKDFIKAAAEYGVELTEEDFQTAGAKEELQDDELDAVAGGSMCFCDRNGGGLEDEYHGTCVCVFVGIGEATDDYYMGCHCGYGGVGDDRSMDSYWS